MSKSSTINVESFVRIGERNLFLFFVHFFIANLMKHMGRIFLEENIKKIK
jgi:hypothetical protein